MIQYYSLEKAKCRVKDTAVYIIVCIVVSLNVVFLLKASLKSVAHAASCIPQEISDTWSCFTDKACVSVDRLAVTIIWEKPCCSG